MTDSDAIAALVRVVRGVQRLMDIADEMDQEGQISVGAPLVIISFFQALRVVVDFVGDAVPAGAFAGNLVALILEANVDEVPRLRGRIFLAKSRIVGTGRSGLHRECDRSLVGRHAEDVGDMTPRRGREVVRRDHRDDAMPITSPCERAPRQQQNG